MADWNEWIGRSRSVTDDIVRNPAQRAAGMLGDLAAADGEGEALPAMWHWFHFLEPVARDRTGPDGHPEKGDFLPPIDLPRRMYAGGRFTFSAPIRFGESAKKTTTILSVSEKEGRSGRLAFVTLRYDIEQGGRIATSEEHDIVYREAATPGAAAPAAPRGEAAVIDQETVQPDEVMLFRFSALTYNGHRIHYDQPYVTGVEGYPGLIVHGPLVALLLFERARRFEPKSRPSSFTFRAVSPVFLGTPIRLARVDSEEDGLAVEARGEDERLIMSSRTTFA